MRCGRWALLLPSASLGQIAAKVQLLRYRMGQAIVLRETMPAQIAILYEGQARLLGYSPSSPLPETLQLLRTGAILGWVGLLRGVACETAIASTESVCLTLAAREFRHLLQQEPDFAAAFHQRCAPAELFELLNAEAERRAIGSLDLKALTLKLTTEALVLTLPPGTTPLSQLDPNLLWLLSGGKTNLAIGGRIDPNAAGTITIESPTARLIGISPAAFDPDSAPLVSPPTPSPSALASASIPYAPEQPPELDEAERSGRKLKYPYVRGSGSIDGSLACFQMLSQYWKMPFRRDVLRRALVNQNHRTGSLSLQFCGAIAELMGLTAQLATVPATAISAIGMHRLSRL